jgi:hypothetical protein
MGMERRTEIAEFQGLYGSFHVSEVLLQKIWLRQLFSAGQARCVGGEALEVLNPGQWNRLSGPDFRGARLRIDGREVRGAVEVHFRTQAWQQHGHHLDPAYETVVLHVVLFPPEPGVPPARTASGRMVPVVALVDLLWHDLEEYAQDEAMAALSGRDPWPLLESLLALEDPARDARLAAAAEKRWVQKVHFARLRIERLGWEEACHQTALEILGYVQNRAAMLRVAARFPWSGWRQHPPATGEILAAVDAGWTSRGVRPANHPRVRLEQYGRWMSAVPDWPGHLAAYVLPEPPDVSGMFEVSRLRREARLPQVRVELSRSICREAVGGSRLDTLVANLVLPFLGAKGHGEAARIPWIAWYPGDVSEGLRKTARQLGSARRPAVLANGILQALIALQLDALSDAEGTGLDSLRA